jgi:hypothetical protein
MEKPLLATVVSDESETPITHQTLNRAVRHVAYLRGPLFTALSQRIQVPFHGVSARQENHFRHPDEAVSAPVAG